MWIRYPIAILIAYCVFLLLLRLWLWAHGRQLKADLDPSVLDFIPPGESGSPESFEIGGGGDFGGAGSGGSWEKALHLRQKPQVVVLPRMELVSIWTWKKAGFWLLQSLR